MMKKEDMYILTNKRNKVLYTGVISNLKKGIWQHKTKFYEKKFTARYNVDKVVYYQFYATIQEAIEEEKRIKAGNRKNKIKLIESINPEWKDLWNELNE